MKFWKRLMDNLEKIVDKNSSISHYLKRIFTEFVSLNQSLTETRLTVNDVSNKDPIKKITPSPLLLLERNKSRMKLTIQNIGREPCYIKLGNRVSKDDYHFVLAPDNIPDFGNGGSISLDNWHGEVYAICETETKLSVLEY